MATPVNSAMDAATAELLAALEPQRRAQEPPVLVYVRPLAASDLQLLSQPKGVSLPLVAQMKQRHHTLAMLLAAGRPDVECSAITGYSPAWISNIKNDPAFKELLVYYARQAEAKYLEVHERLGVLGVMAANELIERLEVKPETLTTKDVREIMKDALDRSGKVDVPQSSGRAAPTVTVRFVTAPEREPEIIDVTPNE